MSQPLPPPAPSPNFPNQPGATIQRSSTMSVWALVLSFLWCIPLAPLVALVLAIVVLAKSKDGVNRGSGKAIAALVISIAGILAVIGGTLGLVSLVRSDSFQEGFADGRDAATGNHLQPGDCFNGGMSTPPAPDAVVSCSESHDWEVFHTFDLPDGEFPGDDASISAAEEGCTSAFQGYVGRAYDTSELEVIYFYPRAGTWVIGDRSVQCMIGTSQPHTGSLRDSQL